MLTKIMLSLQLLYEGHSGGCEHQGLPQTSGPPALGANAKLALVWLHNRSPCLPSPGPVTPTPSRSPCPALSNDQRGQVPQKRKGS